ncbi:hypothetical protein BJX61DRAFT_547295 [Aspergillus egyptiacus]|nr:hypothetical protein BJX61DRAFT_547295 [Aspergillus egyptiacus]
MGIFWLSLPPFFCTLLFDKDEGSIKRAKQLLEQNFIMLLQFRKYWSLVELSMARLRAFHRACQLNSTQEIFDMDRWMADFQNRYDVNVSERCFDELPGPTLNGNRTGLWLQLAEGY